MYIKTDFSNFSHQDLVNVVGQDNSELPYYEKVYNRLKNGTFWTWCWPAFLLEPLWLAYRKLYLEAVLLTTPAFIAFLIEDYLNFDVGFAISLGLNLLWGAFGSSYYLMRNNYKIFSGQEIRSGVSSRVRTGIFLLFFILIIEILGVFSFIKAIGTIVSYNFD